MANNTYRADFIYENLMIQNNVIHSAYENKVKKLLFLGSTCIYPKESSRAVATTRTVASSRLGVVASRTVRGEDEAGMPILYRRAGGLDAACRPSAG